MNMQNLKCIQNKNIGTFGSNSISLFSQQSYTAPCHGFVELHVNPKATSTEGVIVNGSSFGAIHCKAINGNPNTTMGMVKKSDQLNIIATTGLESSSFAIFVPLC